MNDVLSLWPSWSWGVDVKPLPVVGELAPIPSTFNMSSFSSPTLLSLGRHGGCPFIQKEVQTLVRLSNENPTLQVIIVCMLSEEDAPIWFKRIGGDEFKDKSRVKLVADISRQTYGDLGIGYLTFAALFSSKMWSALFKLKEQGIVNTETMPGSNRYQNSGGVAVDKDGIVRFVKVAEHAGDMVDYEAALKTII